MTPIRRASARALACALLLAACPALGQSLASGKVNTGTPTFTNDQNVPLQLDASGALKVTSGGGASTTTTGALEPPTAAAGKIAVTSTAVTASANTTIAAANNSRIAFGIQCGTGGVVVSETGASLASATFGAIGQTIYIPSTAYSYFNPPVATRTAITAYTATAQTCVVTEYLR